MASKRRTPLASPAPETAASRRRAAGVAFEKTPAGELQQEGERKRPKLTWGESAGSVMPALREEDLIRDVSSALGDTDAGLKQRAKRWFAEGMTLQTFRGRIFGSHEWDDARRRRRFVGYFLFHLRQQEGIVDSDALFFEVLAFEKDYYKAKTGRSVQRSKTERDWMTAAETWIAAEEREKEKRERERERRKEFEAELAEATERFDYSGIDPGEIATGRKLRSARYGGRSFTRYIIDGKEETTSSHEALRKGKSAGRAWHIPYYYDPQDRFAVVRKIFKVDDKWEVIAEHWVLFPADPRRRRLLKAVIEAGEIAGAEDVLGETSAGRGVGTQGVKPPGFKTRVGPASKTTKPDVPKATVVRGEKTGKKPGKKPGTATRPSAGRGKAKFGSAATNDYKKTFFDANPGLEGDVIVHHAVEQQVLTRYPGLVSKAEIHSLENLRGIPKGVNAKVHLSKIRKSWNKFYKATPNPSKQQLLNHATKIDDEFGHLFTPAVR